MTTRSRDPNTSPAIACTALVAAALLACGDAPPNDAGADADTTGATVTGTTSGVVADTGDGAGSTGDGGDGSPTSSDSTTTTGSGDESTGTPPADFDPDQVTSCADLGLDGFCIDVYDGQQLFDTKENCPAREVCRVVVHPGEHVTDAAVFTYQHWYRHYIGVLDERGQRPVIRSYGTSHFANKGNTEYQQNTILQNLVLAGPAMGVDFDGAIGEPYLHKGGHSWLDRVEIDVGSRAVLFNGADGVGSGYFWCTDCVLRHHWSVGSPTNMVGISNIDVAWISSSRLEPDDWGNTTVELGARNAQLVDVVDADGVAIECGDWGIECAQGELTDLLREPTLEWFEGLVYANPPPPA